MPTLQNEETARQDKLLRNVLFTFFVTGAACQPIGSLVPFLRSAYGFSYDFSGLLLSAQSFGNLTAVALSGFLPTLLGRRRSILATAVWIAVAYLLFTAGTGLPAVLLLACFMSGFGKGGSGNFSNTMMSTLPGDKATRGFNLLHGAYAIGAILDKLASSLPKPDEEHLFKHHILTTFIISGFLGVLRSFDKEELIRKEAFEKIAEGLENGIRLG